MEVDEMVIDAIEDVRARSLTLRIAGITFRADACTDGLYLGVTPNYVQFLLEGGPADTTIRVHYEELPSELAVEPAGGEVFDSEGGWRLYEQDEHYLFVFWITPHGERPTDVARFDKTFSSGDLYMRPRNVGEAHHHSDGSVTIRPWFRPFDELLLVNRLAVSAGVLVHGASVVWKGGAHVFSGTSGAGKSTLAELWKTAEAQILSDERVVLRRMVDEVYVYGTPRRSSAQVSRPDGAPLAGLYFLAQSDDNYLKPLSPVDALTRLIVRCFPTFYLKSGMDNTIALLSEVVDSVPSYEFGFRNDQSAVDYLKRVWG